MLKTSLLISFLSLVYLPGFCQNYTLGYKSEDGFTSVFRSVTVGSGYTAKNESRYGLINAAKKMVLPLQYKMVYSARQKGIYIVKDTLDNAALFDAAAEKMITGFDYYDIETFSDGLAVVKKRNGSFGFDWGAVDPTGNTVVPIEYQYLGSLQEGLMNFKKDSRFGYMDKNKKVVIPETYYNIADFSNGLAAASPSEAGKMGYIDKNNNMVIPAKYADAGTFYKGYAVVTVKKGYTAGGAGKPTISYPGEVMLINKEGKELTTAAYNTISIYNEGGVFIVTLDKKKGAIDSTGKLILPVEHKDVYSDLAGNLIFQTQEGKYGMVGNKGEVLMKPEYDYIASATYEKLYYKRNGNYAVLDKKRKLIIPEEPAATIIRGKNRILLIHNDKVNVYDGNGKLVKSFQEANIKTYSTSFVSGEDSLKISYDATVELVNIAAGTKKALPTSEAGDFNEEGVFLLKNKDFKYDFYDHTGKKLNQQSYYSAVNFSEGICALQETSTATPYLAGKDFKKIKDLSTRFMGPYSEGLAASVKQGYPSSVVYLDKEGNEKISIKYMTDGGACKNGRMMLYSSPYYYYYNRSGLQLGTNSWDGLADFSDGLAAAKTGGRWGFIDTTGNLVIAASFEEASGFSKGTAIVRQNGKYKLINKKGTAIGNNLYDAAGNPTNGMFPLQKGGKVGLTDEKGNTVIAFNYENIYSTNEDRIWAMKGGKWGLLDTKGKELTGFLYDDASDFSEGFAKVKSGDKIAVINKTGKMVVQPEYGTIGTIYKGMAIGIKPAGVKTYRLP